MAQNLNTCLIISALVWMASDRVTADIRQVSAQSDGNCPDCSLRKPPRYGKRDQQLDRIVNQMIEYFNDLMIDIKEKQKRASAISDYVLGEQRPSRY